MGGVFTDVLGEGVACGTEEDPEPPDEDPVPLGFGDRGGVGLDDPPLGEGVTVGDPDPPLPPGDTGTVGVGVTFGGATRMSHGRALHPSKEFV